MISSEKTPVRFYRMSRDIHKIPVHIEENDSRGYMIHRLLGG